MDLIEIALQSAPQNWLRLRIDAYSEPYKLVEIEEDSDEFEEIKNKFPTSCTIQSIQRVQHPSQFALYLISKDKKRQEGSSIHEVTGYHVIHEEDLKTALTYPMDYRRYKSTDRNISANEYSKQPHFEDTPEKAIANVRNSLTKFKIVICSVLSSSLSSIETKMQWDYFPEYVVSLNHECGVSLNQLEN